VLESVLDAERARLFSRYLARRATLVAGCRLCRGLAPNSVALARLGTITTRSLPAAALVAVPAVLWYSGRDSASEPS
jgi:hypothetical protein